MSKNSVDYYKWMYERKMMKPYNKSDSGGTVYKNKKQGYSGNSYNKKAKSKSAKGVDEQYSRFTSSSKGFSSPFFSSNGWHAEEERSGVGSNFSNGLFTQWEANANRHHEKRLADMSMLHVEREGNRDRSLLDKNFFHVTREASSSDPFGPSTTRTSYMSKDHVTHSFMELTDHEKEMQKQRSAQANQRALLSISEGSNIRRTWLAGLFNHKTSVRAGKLALARDKARYRHISRENKKAAKRERRRIVVQRGYY